MNVCSALALALVLSVPAFAQVPASDADQRVALEHYRAGQEWLATERWKEAAEAFALAIELEPLLTDAHYGLGQAFMGMERFEDAIAAFGGCIEASRRVHDLRVKNRVAADHGIDQEIRELRHTLQRVASGGLRASQPQLKMLQLEQRIDELERSRSSLKAPFEVPASVLLSLGSAHFRLGDRELAERYWTAAVRVNGKLGAAWNNLAVVYMGSGRRAQAVDAVRNAERAGFRVSPGLKERIQAMK